MTALAIHPATPARAADLTSLFAADGMTRGCWCMFWRLPSSEFRSAGRDALRAAFLDLLARAPEPPGLIAYVGNGPAAWVQVTPRTALPRFQRVPTARPAGDTPAGTWALSCFFVRRDLRRNGLMTPLARAACAHAAGRGATAVEAAARRSSGASGTAWGDGFVGYAAALERAGFVAVEGRTPQRVLMRWRPDGPDFSASPA